jgi:arabinogalactan endo-1,4-beta-galactosidase
MSAKKSRFVVLPLCGLFFAGLALKPAGGADAVAPSPDTAAQPVHRTEPFILGADISWVPQDEAQGATYWDKGVQKDIFQILKEHKFNYVRLRTFVDPKAPGGYASRNTEAFCDIEHTKAMAKRAKAAGMKILLNLHYSDTWASPGHQNKPSAWAKLSFPDLVKAVHDYTYSVVAALKAQGTPADMAEIGNEISDGMLFPDGSTSNYDQFAALLKAGIAGAKEADPSVKIMLHHHLGRSNDVMRPWLDNLIKRGVKFDVIGMSCYAQAKEGDWKTNFDDLAMRYPDKLLVATEYSAKKREVNDLIFNAPEKRGLGTFIWEPTRWREALFDKDGVNAGGGGATNDLGQPLKPPVGTAPATGAAPATGTATGVANATNTPGTAPAPMRRFNHGGRYDTNSFFDLYPQMSKDYGNDEAAGP